MGPAGERALFVTRYRHRLAAAGKTEGKLRRRQVEQRDDKPATRGDKRSENASKQRRGLPADRQCRETSRRPDASAVLKPICRASSRWQVRTTTTRLSARVPSRDPIKRHGLPPLNQRFDRVFTPEQCRGGRGAGEENTTAHVDSAGVGLRACRFSGYAIDGKWEPGLSFGQKGSW